MEIEAVRSFEAGAMAAKNRGVGVQGLGLGFRVGGVAGVWDGFCGSRPW